MVALAPGVLLLLLPPRLSAVSSAGALTTCMDAAEVATVARWWWREGDARRGPGGEREVRTGREAGWRRGADHDAVA